MGSKGRTVAVVAGVMVLSMLAPSYGVGAAQERPTPSKDGLNPKEVARLTRVARGRALHVGRSAKALTASEVARKIAQGRAVAGTVSSTDPQDVYSVSLTGGDVVSFDLDHGTEAHVGVAVLDASSNFLGGSNARSRTDERFIFEAPSSADYIVVAYLDSGTGPCGYTLNVTSFGADTTDADTYDLPPGWAVQRLDYSGGDDSKDTYVVPLQAGESLRFYLGCVDAYGDETGFEGQIILKDPNGNQVNSSDWAGWGTRWVGFEQAIDEAGNWTLEVEGSDGYYSLSVCYPATLIRSAPSARTLTYGGRTTFVGVLSAGGDPHAGTVALIVSSKGWVSSPANVIQYPYNAAYGYFAKMVKPLRNDAYYALWAADSDHDAALSSGVRITVRGSVGLSMTPRLTTRRRAVRILITVKPNNAGRTVYLQVRLRRRWYNIARGRLYAPDNKLYTTSYVTGRFRLPRGRWAFRARFIGTTAYGGNASNYSRAVTVRVR